MSETVQFFLFYVRSYAGLDEQRRRANTFNHYRLKVIISFYFYAF